jgi:hypothetical protein
MTSLVNARQLEEMDRSSVSFGVLQRGHEVFTFSYDAAACLSIEQLLFMQYYPDSSPQMPVPAQIPRIASFPLMFTALYHKVLSPH